MAVIYQTYRPATFKDVIGQQHVITTIQNQYGSGSLAHAYLFTGPRGVGKTTTARLLAKIVNCLDVQGGEPCNRCEACVSIASGQALDVYEIDAASHTDVENVRENIIKSVRFAPNRLKKKVYIIDEVHMLSTSSFNALLKTLEEPPAHALFILATTEIHKVPETIISRCQRFDFKRISQEAMMERLTMIACEEEVEVAHDVLSAIARHSGGCARDAESLLGQVLALGEKTITLEIASLVLPTTNAVIVEDFIKSLLAKQAALAIQQVNDYADQGIDLVQFLDDVIARLRDGLLDAISGKGTDVLRGSASELRFAIQHLLEARNAARGDFLPQLPIELAIVDCCASSLAHGVVAPLPVQPTSPVSPSTPVSPVLPTVENKELVVSHSEVIKPDVAEYLSPPTVEQIAVSIPETAETLIETVAASETVFDTIPVLSIEEVRRKWPEVFDQLKDCNATLPLIMNGCEVCDITGDRVELAFEYDLHVQAVNKEKNRVLIESVLKRVLGHPVRINAVKASKQADQSVVDLAAQFGGNVV